MTTIINATASPTQLTKKEIKEQLRQGIVQISYTKLGGTLNNRKATLNFALIPIKDHPNGNGKEGDSDNGYIKYYDLDKGEWRQFHVERLKETSLLFELQVVNEEYEYHSLRFKKLHYEAVKRVAKKLFEKWMVLTTLSLKQELRKQGYWATQEQVSKLMNEVFEKEGIWDYQQQPGEAYRIYFLKNVQLT